MLKAMLLGTYVNPPYHPLRGIDTLLSFLLSDTFSLEITDQPDDLQKLSSEYRLVLSYLDQWDTPIPDADADALVRFVQEGGGLLVIHNGISLQADLRLLEMMGGKFTHHPPQEPITFQALPGSFLSDCPDFTISEEPYQFDHLGSLTPILSYTYRGNKYLAGWEKTCGKGRVVFLAPGHALSTFEDKSFQEMIHLSAKRCAGII